MQRRGIECQIDNNTLVEQELCDEQTKPSIRQECFNDKCKGTWRVGDWSEVTIFYFSLYSFTTLNFLSLCMINVTSQF